MSCENLSMGCGSCSAAQTGNLSLSFSESQIVLLCNNLLSNTVTPSELNSVILTTQGITEGLNCTYLFLTAALVFIMHGGFAMLCAGAIRSKNTMNILLQTILDAASSAIAFFICGYAFAYGGYWYSNDTYTIQPNQVIGTALFGLSKYESQNTNNQVDGNGNVFSVHWQDFVFQWAFAATATTIPAGCVAERCNFNAYLGYSFFIAAWVYPMVVHWAWSAYGWMGYGRVVMPHIVSAGYIDFAGSGVVHMVGGFSGMWGCILMGPRMGRFDSNGNPVDMPGHSPTLVVLGTVLLWFGWYGFNPGSMIFINSFNGAMVVGRAAVTTTLAGAAGGMMGLCWGFFRHKVGQER